MERLAQLAAEHLLLRMRTLNRNVEQAVARQRDRNRALAVSKAKGLYLSDAQVAELIACVQKVVSRAGDAAAAEGPDADEAALEQGLRTAAMLEGKLLPFDRLATSGLTRQEQDALVVCAAVEIDRSYERIFAYILDDLTRHTPSVALLVEITCTGIMQRAWSLHVLGPFGGLRRRRLLVATGDAPSEARQELRLGPGVLDYLLTGRASPASVFRDRAEVEIPAELCMPAGVEAARIRTMGEAARAGKVGVIGLWGSDTGGIASLVHLLACAAGSPVRRLVSGDIRCRENCPREEVRKAFLVCATLQTLLWVEIDQLVGEAGEAALETVAEQLVVSATPVILSGKTPWRPTEMLASRSFGELDLGDPGYAQRTAMWFDAAPDLPVARHQDLAARFRLSSNELRAAARLAGTSAVLAGNGHPAPRDGFLEHACATVSQRASLSFARAITPKRRAADLVLPAAIHDQVMEIARSARIWPRVAEEWGFSRLDPAACAVKVLFTGDSGTGKTAAAEVIAYEIGGAPLIKVDLARVVSKWVGETEKNLAAIFDEARTRHAVLFFDEADALFGRRGDVQRGADRYANLEVSYLLQRLDEHDAGVVILASNLKDNIDPAFTRRFQVTLHFPRPPLELRRRLWQLAIPDRAPLDGVDFDTLARVDLTGGGIAGAARTAALLAADAGSATIGMDHLVRGIARQFKREARLVMPAELGPFAGLLQEKQER